MKLEPLPLDWTRSPFWTRDADRLLASFAPLEENTICGTEVQVIGTIAFLLPPLVGLGT